jgi:putative flavoprotein involved in K+ transport
MVVVGAGNSGMQIAPELAATRPVVLSVGASPPMLPQRLLGRDLFWWLTKLRLLGVAGTSRLGSRMRSRGEFVIGSNRRQCAGPESGSAPGWSTRPAQRSGSLTAAHNRSAA